MPEKTPLTEVINLKAGYGDKVILEKIDLKIFPREVVTIIGGSGSGKTTLMKNFIGLLRPLEGNVRVFDKDWWDLEEKERELMRREIGVLFQHGALLGSKNVGVNLAIPLEQHTSLPDAVIKRVVKLKLRQVGLGDAFDLTPNELSGGMRKRAALARALALDPPLIFCDEPSAGLDPVTSYHLDKLLLDLRDNLGLTVVVVTHELASIKRIADRIVYLQKGKLVFNGTVKEAVNSEIESVREFFKVGENGDRAE